MGIRETYYDIRGSNSNDTYDGYCGTPVLIALACMVIQAYAVAYGGNYKVIRGRTYVYGVRNARGYGGTPVPTVAREAVVGPPGPRDSAGNPLVEL